MGVLDTINGPQDVKRLGSDDLAALAAEIRDLLVSSVARGGGHLGPNLGVVELTIALHRVFDSPRDPILWDTGHQAYVHKMLTGRADRFDTLRQEGGLSGYPSQAESEHDFIENSHASTALSYADGMAKALKLRGETDRTVVAVIGDGALTGGMAWEAINNIAMRKDLPIVIVVNDNGRSYSPTIGGLAKHLAALRASRNYENALGFIKENLGRVPVVGTPLYETLHGVKKGLKDILAPQVLFEDLGLKYIGPINGHDVAAMESALRTAPGLPRPGDRARDHPQGHGLRPGREPRRGLLPLARRRSTSPPARSGLAPTAGPTCSARRWCGSARSARRSWRSPPRCSTPPGSRRSPRSTPTASSTSASPSSTRSPPPPGSRSAGCTRWSRSTRPSSTAPSTSCSWTWRCTGCRSPSCSTGPASPATTGPATTACGTCRSCR